MHSNEIRALIREVLEEEIGKIKRTQRHTGPRPAEKVAIGGDNDLNAFARKIASLCSDATIRQQLMSGEHQFTLVKTSTNGANYAPATPNSTSSTVTYGKGLLNEKTIDALPDGVNTIHAGPRACFTPLARDRMRQRGIALKKVEP